MKLTKILAATAVVAFMISAMPGDEVISKDNDTTIVNTTSLSKGVRGFKGATPVKIYIKKNKVVKIEALILTRLRLLLLNMKARQLRRLLLWTLMA